MPKIKFYRGLKANLPVLDEATPAFTTDTEEFFIGSKDGNIKFSNRDDLLAELAGVNANAEIIAARGTYPTLAPRLDNVDTSLTNIATYKEINMAIPFGTTLTALKGDGTDETAALLAALNYVGDNHLTIYIPKNMTVSIDVLTVLNKTNFGIRCEGTIKRLDNSPTIGSSFKLDTCSKFTIYEINFDGNGLNNGCVEGTAYTSAQQYKHSMELSNCSNFKLDKFYVLNPCGDGIYISNGTNNGVFGSVIGHADIKIGRNLMSFINAHDIYIDYFFNDGCGHYDMPGAFDIEPNLSTDVVRNIFVNTMNIRSGGANPLSILQTNSATVENVFIDKAQVTYIGSSNNVCVLISSSDVQINQLKVDGGGLSDIIKVDSITTTSKNVFIRKLSGKNGYRGINLGFTNQVQNVEINATLTNMTFDGVAVWWVKNVKLNVDIDSVGSARYMVNFAPSGSATADTVTISGNLSKRGTGIKAVGTSSASTALLNIILDNLDFTGWATGDKIFGAGLQAIKRKTNCPNLTHQTAIPSGSTDQWVQGDIVWNNGTDNTVAFWRRMTTGAGNVLNTDWKAY